MNQSDVTKEAMTSSEVLEEGNNLGAMFYQEAEQSAANEDVQLAGDMFGFEPHKGDQMVFNDVKNEVDVIGDGMRKSEGFSPKVSKKRRDSPPPSHAYISHHPHEQAGQPLLDLSHQQQQRHQQATHVIHHRPQDMQMQGYQFQNGGFPQVLSHNEEIQFQQSYQQQGEQGRVYHMYEGAEGGVELMEEEEKVMGEQHFMGYQGEKQEMEGHHEGAMEGGEGFENFCAPDKNIDDILKGTRGNEERKMQIEEWVKLVGV